MKHKKYCIGTIGAYWYNRPQTLQSCAEQALSFIQKLTQANPILFTKWRARGNSRAETMRNIAPLTYEGIKNLLAEKYYRCHIKGLWLIRITKKKLIKNDQDQDYADHAFSGSLWNAHPDGEAASVSFTLGRPEPKQRSNHCIIHLPYEGPQYEYYCQGANRQVLMQLLEEHWQPEEISLSRDDDIKKDVPIAKDRDKGVLLEAKPGYNQFVSKEGEFKKWFSTIGLTKQAARQLKGAEDMPLEWHFEYETVYKAVKKAFSKRHSMQDIQLIHTPRS